MPAHSDLQMLLQDLQPVVNAGQFVFATLDSSTALDLRDAIAFVREPEGLSVILEQADARRLGVPTKSKFSWITLSVNSDLHAVGLTAAFSCALGRAGISCNVVAGTHHDHLFVPVEQVAVAMAQLQALQQGASADADRRD